MLNPDWKKKLVVFLVAVSQSGLHSKQLQVPGRAH